MLFDQFASLPQPYDLEHIFRSRAQIAFVRRAVHDLLQFDTGANVERADALGGVKLVPRYREQIHAQLIHPHRNLSDGLGRIRMQEDIVAMRKLCDLINRLYRSHLVVGVHHRDQGRLRRDGALQGLHVDQAGFIHRHVGHLEALFLQIGAYFQHRRMFDGSGDDVAAAPPLRQRRPFDCQVVGFRTAASEDDLLRAAAQHAGDLPAGSLHSLFGFDAKSMTAGWVSEMAVEERQHGFRHLRINGCGGVVIQIDGFFGHTGIVSKKYPACLTSWLEFRRP